VLFPDSPVAFVFSTGASSQDPLQKDFMRDLNFLAHRPSFSAPDHAERAAEPSLTDASLDR
jgi:hypothetical protein